MRTSLDNLVEHLHSTRDFFSKSLSDIKRNAVIVTSAGILATVGCAVEQPIPTPTPTQISRDYYMLGISRESSDYLRINATHPQKGTSYFYLATSADARSFLSEVNAVLRVPYAREEMFNMALDFMQDQIITSEELARIRDIDGDGFPNSEELFKGTSLTIPDATPTPLPTPIPTPTPTPTVVSTPTPYPTPTPIPIIKAEIVDTKFSEGLKATIRFQNTGNVPLRFVDGLCNPPTGNKTSCGDIVVERRNGLGRASLSGNKALIFPREIGILVDGACQLEGYPPRCVYKITLRSGEGLEAVVDSPNVLEAVKNNAITNDLIESAIIRRSIGTGSFNDSLYNDTFDFEGNLIFSSYYLRVEGRNAQITGALSIYSGVRRSDLIERTRLLTDVLREKAGTSLPYIQSLYIFQVSPVNKEEAVAALEYSIPIRLNSPEPELWEFDDIALQKIPNFFPKALPILVGIYVRPTTDLATLSGGLAYPIRSVYSIQRFEGLSANEAGGYFDATDNLSLEEMVDFIEAFTSGVSLSDMLKLFDRMVGNIQKARILYNPVTFYSNLVWRVPVN